MPVDQIAKTFTLTVKQDTFDQFQKSGFVYDFTFPIKKPGAYQLRVALRDRATDRVGSANQFIEVPNIKKDRLVLSGVLLENIPPEEWKLRSEGKPSKYESDPLTDTSLRQYKRGTVLSYGLAAFNARPGSAAGGNVSFRIRIFRDGNSIFEGKSQPAAHRPSDAKVADVTGSLVLGSAMVPGDYVLQIIVTDKLAKEKYSTTSQFVQFEIIE